MPSFCAKQRRRASIGYHVLAVACLATVALGVDNVETSMNNLIKSGASVVLHLSSIGGMSKDKRGEVELPQNSVVAGLGEDCGSQFITGNFHGSIDAGAYQLKAELKDIFIAKVSPVGCVDWVVHGGGPMDDTSTSISYNGFDALYITGHMSLSSSFGAPLYRTEVMSMPSAEGNGFVIKVSTKGTIQWIAKVTGPNKQKVNAGATDSVHGHVYIVGSTFGLARFHHGNRSENAEEGRAARAQETVPGTPLTLANTGVKQRFVHAFMAKVSSDGQVMWVRRMGPGSEGGTERGNDELTNVAVTSLQSVYASGTFSGPSSWLDSYMDETGLNRVLVKADMHGHPLWTVSLGKADVIRTGGLVADMGGNAYIAGDFPTKAAPYVLVGSRNSSRPGHPFVLESANPPSTNRDVFVLKLDLKGTPLWARTVGGSGDDTASEAGSLSVTAGGHLLLGGTITATALNGVQTLQVPVGLDSTPFVVKYFLNGTVAWGTSAGFLDGDIRMGSLHADGCGNAIVVGSYHHGRFGNKKKKTPHGLAAYVAKIGNVFQQCLCVDTHKKTSKHMEGTHVIFTIGVVAIFAVTGCMVWLYAWWLRRKPKNPSERGFHPFNPAVEMLRRHSGIDVFSNSSRPWSGSGYPTKPPGQSGTFGASGVAAKLLNDIGPLTSGYSMKAIQDTAAIMNQHKATCSFKDKPDAAAIAATRQKIASMRSQRS
eukprot:CAMPEP_0114282482 /NCGR_PEP_ID=MMETSP0059-20121206/3585_1 /TAXON_ID=36894 /ORGANISM="Pyramimonas parkeae, Strain CCMP726" /LENGTH=709 /DNA_ID=CAMNT_0001403133 /DNA_START=176 /DNA_END=2306 /DNA_ORIENTATION=+